MRQRTPARVLASAPMIADEPASTEQRFRAAEHDVERASAALKKELRLVDLVGIQILNIVGLFGVGTAGKLGSSHVMFWIPMQRMRWGRARGGCLRARR